MSFHLLRLSEVGEMDYTSIVTCARYYNAVPKERKDRGFDLLFPLITPQSFEQYIEDTHQIDSFAEEEKSRYKKFLSDYKEYCRIKLLAMPHAKKVEHDEAVATERPQLNFPEIEMMNYTSVEAYAKKYSKQMPQHSKMEVFDSIFLLLNPDILHRHTKTENKSFSTKEFLNYMDFSRDYSTHYTATLSNLQSSTVTAYHGYFRFFTTVYNTKEKLESNRNAIYSAQNVIILDNPKHNECQLALLKLKKEAEEIYQEVLLVIEELSISRNELRMLISGDLRDAYAAPIVSAYTGRRSVSAPVRSAREEPQDQTRRHRGF